MIDQSKQFILRSNNKIVEKVGSGYETVGLISEFSDSIEFNDGHLSIYYDSDRDLSVDRHAPILSLALSDDSGNPINWSYDIVNDATRNTNIRIITGAGNLPPYTVSPFLFDSNLYGASTIINVKGTVSGNNPTILDDSGYPINLPLELSYLYCNDYFITTNYTSKECLKFADMGTPAIRYVSSMNPIINLNTDPSGLHFSDSGQYLYVMGDQGDTIKQYEMNPPFSLLSSIDSGNNSFQIYSTYQTGSKRDLFLNPSGDRMFILSKDPDMVYQYDLDSPDMVSSSQFKVSYYESVHLDRDISLSKDGSKLYSLSDDRNLYQYSLYEPYRISSSDRTPPKKYLFGEYTEVQTVLRYRRVYYSGYSGWQAYYTYYYHQGYPQAFCFSDNGEYLYEVTGIAYDKGRIRRFTLSTPWDITTIGAVQTRYHQIGQGATAPDNVNNGKETGIWGIRVSKDGSKLLLMSREYSTDRPARVLQYNMSVNFSLNSLPNILTYINANSTLYLNEVPYMRYVPVYNSLGTIIYYTYENPNFNRYINGFEFDSAGNKMFISNHQNIYEYQTSSFNIAGSSFVNSYAITELDTTTKSIKLMSDQDFYIQNSHKIYQYDYVNDSIGDIELSYTSKEFSFSEETSPEGMIFTRDGTKMYIVGLSNRNIHEYLLSVPFEIHSAVYNDTLITSNLLAAPRGLTLNPDEDTLYVVSNNTVYSFDIKSPFNTSTPTGDLFNVTYNVNTLNGIRWNGDGTRFSVIGTNTVGIDEYETKNVFSVKPL